MLDDYRTCSTTTTRRDTPMAGDYTRYDLEQITGWTASVFESLGAPKPDAGVTAATLIHADLMGIDSHGLNRLPVNSYADGLQSGDIDAKAAPEIVHEEASTAVIDGQ